MINMWESRFKTWKICKKSIIYIFMYTIVETRFDMFLGVTIDETLQKRGYLWISGCGEANYQPSPSCQLLG